MGLFRRRRRTPQPFLPEEPYDEAEAAGAPRPGEDLARVDVLPNLPDGYVRLGTLAAEEAYVVHGFLTSNGVEAVLLMPGWHGAIAHTRQAPTQLGVAVPEDRMEETRELLRSADLIPGDPEG